jgi:AhpD family alkylhydroperoxidase
MKCLEPQTVESARAGSKQGMKAFRKKFGFISNLMATFANSPSVLNGYLALDTAWERSSLSATDRQIILLTASVENRCLYGTAAHATVLKAMKLDVAVIKAIRSRKSLPDERQDALVALTRELVRERGFVAESVKERFFKARYNEATMMEVLIGVALKTMSNYLDHLNPISIDPVFRAEADESISN